MRKISVILLICLLLIAMVGCAHNQKVEQKQKIAIGPATQEEPIVTDDVVIDDATDKEVINDTNEPVSTQKDASEIALPEENTNESSNKELVFKEEYSTLSKDAIAIQDVGTITLEQNADGWTAKSINITSDQDFIDLVISDNEQYRITEIADDFLRENKKLRSLNLSALNNLVRIGQHAFYKCANLTSVSLSVTVKSFGKFAFLVTPWIQSQQLNNSGLVVVNNVLIDGSAATGNVVIPSNVETISERAFSHNSKITSLTVPQDAQVRVIPYLAFANCANLTTISLAPIQEIYANAFQGCKKLTTINNVSSNLIKVGVHAFQGCESLVSFDVSTSPAFTTIGVGAFKDSGIQSVKMNPSIRFVSANAFLNCVRLTEVVFAASSTDLQSIGDCAFAGCEALATITNLPSVPLGRNWKYGTAIN